MAMEAARLSIAIEPHVYERLCALAKRRGLSVDEYCRQAVAQVVERDAPLMMTVGERLKALDQIDAARRETFGRESVPWDSVEAIREDRAIRADQIDRAVRGDLTTTAAPHFLYPDRSSANLGAAQ